jgi:branched-chain amino acid transport system permease protein
VSGPALQLLANGLVEGSAYALLALGFALIFGASRIFHVAHGSVYAVAGYLLYALVTLARLPFLLAFGLTVALAAGLGVAIEMWIYRPLGRRGASHILILMASIGTLIFLDNLVEAVFGGDNKTVGVGGALQQAVPLGPVVFTYLQLVGLGVAVACLLGLNWLRRRTDAGRALRAVTINPAMARIVGIDIGRVRVLAFGLGSALAAVSAAMGAVDVGVEPGRGLSVVLVAAIAVLVGGVDTFTGAALGGLLLGLAMNLGVWRVGAEWREALAFGVMLAFILVRPTGLAGRRLERHEV